MPLTMEIDRPAFVREQEHITQFRDISWTSDLLYSDPTRQIVSEFVVADTIYRLLQPAHAMFEPPTTYGTGRYVVAGFQTDFIGRGNTLDEARRDWEEKIDLEIQTLLATEDFERTSNQIESWNALSKKFDLNEIRYSRPLLCRGYGVLTSFLPRPIRVRWVDGTKSTLSREHIPVEMVGYKVGQPFEAVLHRNARTWELERIVAVFRAKSLPAPGEVDNELSIEKLQPSSNLPKLDWK